MMDKEPPDEIHTTAQDCFAFLVSNNQPSNQLSKVLIESQKPNNLDQYLFTWTKLISSNELDEILALLRSLQVLDITDCEEITNGCINSNTIKKVIALVDVLVKRGPHGLWYMIHALRAHHPGFFDKLHGKIRCCVCDEVQRIQIEVTSPDEIAVLIQEESALPIPKRREVFEDLLRRVETMKANFSRMENSIKVMIQPLTHLKNELEDVMSDQASNNEPFCPKNISMLKKAKNKFLKLIKKRLCHVTQENNEAVTEPLKSKGINVEDEKKPNHSILNLEENFTWTHFSFNPLPTIQRFFAPVTSYVKNNSTKVLCLIGVTICVEMVGSYAIDYGLSTL